MSRRYEKGYAREPIFFFLILRVFIHTILYNKTSPWDGILVLAKNLNGPGSKSTEIDKIDVYYLTFAFWFCGRLLIVQSKTSL